MHSVGTRKKNVKQCREFWFTGNKCCSFYVLVALIQTYIILQCVVILPLLYDNKRLKDKEMTFTLHLGGCGERKLD